MVAVRSSMRLLLLAGLGLMMQAVFAAGLTITPETQHVELGQPIWLTLQSDQTAVPLDTLDFSPWRQQVAIPHVYGVNLIHHDRVQQLRFPVYPLHSGQLILPGLHFLQQTTPALAFTIAPARDPRTHTPITFAYRISSLHPWQQQQVIVACRIRMHDHYAFFTQANAGNSDMHVLPMRVQRQTVASGAAAQTRYRLGWVIWPSRAGKQQLQLPPIQYVRDGVVVRRFYVPPLTLDVRALPAWLPGTIPVGRIRIIRYRLARSWLSTSVLSQLRLQIQVDGMRPELIPDYSQQLQSNRQMEFYAAQSQTNTLIDAQGLHQKLTYRVPLVAKHLGMYQLPRLRLQYFDPLSGMLKTQTVPGPPSIVLNPWLERGGLLLVLVLVLWLARKLLHYLQTYWRRFRTYQLALRQLGQADSLATIKQVMQTMARAEGWNPNLSYLQWQACMQSKTALADQLAVTQLNAAGYGRRELRVADAAMRLARICRQRRLALR